MSQHCRICGAGTTLAFEPLVLGRYRSQLRYCAHCRYLALSDPHWLAQAYASPIARADVGIVARNLKIAATLSALLYYCFDRGGRYLDCGGGSGLLVRLMRDNGYDFRWSDSYCPNLLAPGFEAAPHEAGFEAVTAFEVLEHLTEPMGFIEQQVGRTATGTLIFSTDLHGGTPPPPDWYYYAFEMGQHIGFFSRETLSYVAGRVNLNFYSHRGVHIFTRRDLGAYNLRKILKHRGWYQRWAERHYHSLAETDRAALLAAVLRP